MQEYEILQREIEELRLDVPRIDAMAAEQPATR
jgi:hypothetical protein